jgi:hypothetical protein
MMHLQYENMRKNLQEQFYVNVPFPISRGVIDDAIPINQGMLFSCLQVTLKK